jgi:hypothetical protein
VELIPSFRILSWVNSGNSLSLNVKFELWGDLIHAMEYTYNLQTVGQLRIRKVWQVWTVFRRKSVSQPNKVYE